MEKSYWLNRWETGNIRFNEPTPHRYLKKFFHLLSLKEEEDIFVPLCGKSIDMVWLTQCNQKVVGVEISPIAISAFLDENNLNATETREGEFLVYEHQCYKFYQGDLFKLTRKNLTNIKGIYDRGCLTALPPNTLREHYADWLKTTIPVKSKMLLIVMEHNNTNATEPPFSTSVSDIKFMLSSHFILQALEREHLKDIKPHWAERGIQELYECAYLLEKYN